MKFAILILVSVFTVTVAYSEAPAPAPQQPADVPAATGDNFSEEGSAGGADAEKVNALKQAIREKLWRKLSVRYGRKGKVALLKPVNSTNGNFNELMLNTLTQGITKFGEFDLTIHDFKIDALTLEDFRRVLIRSEADVILITSIKADQMNMFIYDRLTPYYVYAHSEALPDPQSYELNDALVASYTKLLLRRTLFEYVEDQYFELPRGDLTPVLKTEVPRWVASAESLAFVNRELSSRFYGGLSLGAALTKGAYDKSFWNSNILSIQLGYRAFAGLFVEAAYEAFTYNAFLGSVKYLFATKNSPIRFSFGLGFARTSNRMALNYDETQAFPATSNFVVPTIGVMFPIVDVHFKIESRMYFGLTRGGAMFTLMPGIIAQF